MRSAEYLKYMASFKWETRRERALAKVNGRCQECGRLGFLEVHHLTYENLGNEYDDDLLVVCHPCHAKLDTQRRAEKESERWNKRLDSWASKKYGDDWADYDDGWEVEEEFKEWLFDQEMA